MENQIFKSAILDFSVSSQHAIAEVPKITFSTQDSGGTAKLIFATKKDGVSLSLSNAAEISLAMIMSVGKDYESRYLVNPTIIDRVKGLIEYSLTDDQIGHDGQVEAELYVKYQNQTMQINRFSFSIEKAMIDDDFMPVQTYYVEKWDDYDKIFDDKVSVLQSEIDDLQAQSNDVRQQFDSFNLNQFTQKADFENHIYNSDIHVTTENKISWEAKETPANAQTKATKALTDAKIYSDSLLDSYGPWVNVPLAAGYSTGDSNPPQYRLITKQTLAGPKTFAEFKGAIAGTFSSTANSTTATMPAGARPAGTYYGSGESNNGNGGRIAIPVNGQILQVSSTDNANPAYVGLSTIIYEIGN
ncbi:phage baseplate upper protein [Listeria seeligeri]|uniref:Phage baseplate upper protein n=1 Tax=Listeria seeligeri TaxID=1640 RepID=A0A7X0X1L9_LISSE|nr:phage baseplate upper protein [Listeria seeligeri]MBC1485979.1 phage baseplate upper protein [Listeria seeligeri]